MCRRATAKRCAAIRAPKSTYKRNGTLNLFGALQIDTAGKVVGRVTETKKREDFRHFMDELLAELPQDKAIHVILENLNTHKKNEDWLAKYEGRVSLHFTPTSASWPTSHRSVVRLACPQGPARSLLWQQARLAGSH